LQNFVVVVCDERINMAEAVADDQKLSIVKRLISEAPPGEFKEVVNGQLKI